MSNLPFLGRPQVDGKAVHVADDPLMGVVTHGSSASVARPSGFPSVTWVGSVQPENAIDGDVWMQDGAAGSWGFAEETLLASHVVTANTASVTIPVPEGDGYSAIIIRVRAKGDQTLASDLHCRFNGDATAIYDFHGESASQANQTTVRIGSAVVGVDAGSGRYGGIDFKIDRPNAQDGRYRYGTISGLHRDGTVTGGWHWRSTASIKTATWWPTLGVLTAGTRFDVIGVREPAPIAVHTLSANQATWNIPIPDGYDDIELRYRIQGAATSEDMTFTINGDTASNYEYHANSTTTGNTLVRMGESPTTNFRIGVLRIADLADRTKFLAGSFFEGHSNLRNVGHWRWRSLAKPEYFTFARISAGLFAAGSQIEVYGVRRKNLVASYVAGVGGQAAPWTFPIPQGYDEIIVEARLRSNRAALTDQARLRLNQNDAAVYDSQAAGNSSRLAETSISFESDSITGSTAPAGRWSLTRFTIQTGNVDAETHQRFGTFSSYGTASAGSRAGAFRYRSNDPAITSATLLLDIGPNFVAGSEIKVYGINRAKELPPITHDGTPVIGDLLKAKSLSPLVMEKVDLLGSVHRGGVGGGYEISYSAPGWSINAQGTGFGHNLNQTFYWPITLNSSAIADRIAVRVTIATSAGGLLRLGIYKAGAGWQPGALVLDAGDVAVDSTGVKAITINQALPAGRYLLATNSRIAGSLSLASFNGGSPTQEIDDGLVNVGLRNWALLATISSFPNPGTAWWSATQSSISLHIPVFLRLISQG
jgi:hypothetical protein